MRIISKEPPSDGVAFHQAYADELGKRVIPRWARESLSGLLWITIFLVVLAVTRTFAKAVAITYFVLLIQWAWQKGFAYLYKRRAARYLAAFPDAELYIYGLVGGHFISENRGLRYSFPMSAFSHTFQDDKNIYFDFSSLGRIRVPLAAFKSVDERLEFVRSAEEMKKPNQLPDPTTPFVAPPAKAGAAPSVAAEH
jgi:hypothetical protein